MTIIGRKRPFVLGVLVASLFAIQPVFANGPVGEHVNHLTDNLDNYTKEVNWLKSQFDEIVTTYAEKGADAVDTQVLIDDWESVDFHAAIETNYVPVYSMIWQGLYGVKETIEDGASIDDVREQQAFFEQSLWQGLGAVKMAAVFQDKGLTEHIKTTEENPTNSLEALELIQHKLNTVVAKYAEQLNKEAVDIVHNTYLSLFEGVEGELIAKDAALVEDLEKDFNVVLPQAIQKGGSVDEVRDVVSTMQGKLDKAYTLLETAEEEQKDVF